MDVPGGWTNCMEVFRETKAKGWIWLIIPEGEGTYRECKERRDED